MPDKKPPRSTSTSQSPVISRGSMSSTPIEGIRSMPDFDAEQDTGVTSTDTPVGLETINSEAELRLRNAATNLARLDAEAGLRLSSRVKATNERVESIKEVSEKTFVGVDTLRTEMVEHVSSLRSEIGGVRSDLGEFKTAVGSKIDELGGHVLSAMGSVNTAVVALNQFQGIVIEDKMETHREYAAIDVNRTILADDAHADKKKLNRGVWYELGKKAGVVLLGLLGIVATAYITHRIEH